MTMDLLIFIKKYGVDTEEERLNYYIKDKIHYLSYEQTQTYNPADKNQQELVNLIKMRDEWPSFSLDDKIKLKIYNALNNKYTSLMIAEPYFESVVDQFFRAYEYKNTKSYEVEEELFKKEIEDFNINCL